MYDKDTDSLILATSNHKHFSIQAIEPETGEQIVVEKVRHNITCLEVWRYKPGRRYLCVGAGEKDAGVILVYDLKPNDAKQSGRFKFKLLSVLNLAGGPVIAMSTLLNSYMVAATPREILQIKISANSKPRTIVIGATEKVRYPVLRIQTNNEYVITGGHMDSMNLYVFAKNFELLKSDRVLRQSKDVVIFDNCIVCTDGKGLVYALPFGM